MQYGKPQFGMQRAQANALRNTNGNFGNQFGGGAGPFQQPQPATSPSGTEYTGGGSVANLLDAQIGDNSSLIYNGSQPMQPGVLSARPMQPQQPGPHPVEMPQPIAPGPWLDTQPVMPTPQYPQYQKLQPTMGSNGSQPMQPGPHPVEMPQPVNGIGFGNTGSLVNRGGMPGRGRNLPPDFGLGYGNRGQNLTRPPMTRGPMPRTGRFGG